MGCSAMFLKVWLPSATGCPDMKCLNQPKASRQRGAVLLISLVFLLLLTVIGLSAIQSSTLQERMAGNANDINTAFQAAEAGIREAEAVLQQASLPNFDGSGGRFLVCTNPDSTAASCTVPAWNDTASNGWAALSGIDGVARQPQYYIQKYVSVYDPLGDLSSDTPPKILDIYKVVSRGFGLSDKSLTALETTYRRD